MVYCSLPSIPDRVWVRGTPRRRSGAGFPLRFLHLSGRGGKKKKHNTLKIDLRSCCLTVWATKMKRQGDRWFRWPPQRVTLGWELEGPEGSWPCKDYRSMILDKGAACAKAWAVLLSVRKEKEESCNWELVSLQHDGTQGILGFFSAWGAAQDFHHITPATSYPASVGLWLWNFQEYHHYNRSSPAPCARDWMCFLLKPTGFLK